VFLKSSRTEISSIFFYLAILRYNREVYAKSAEFTRGNLAFCNEFLKIPSKSVAKSAGEDYNGVCCPVRDRAK
jgi:hypothetical protein